jgi:DNA-binding MarR family transcriptional regulator
LSAAVHLLLVAFNVEGIGLWFASLDRARTASGSNAWKVITVLGRFGPLSASQIHAHTTLEADKITRIVDSLVEQGLATRRQDKADRRRVSVALSPKGKSVNAGIERMIGEMEQEFLAVLNRSERAMLYKLLDRLQARGQQIFKATPA